LIPIVSDYGATRPASNHNAARDGASSYLFLNRTIYLLSQPKFRHPLLVKAGHFGRL